MKKFFGIGAAFFALAFAALFFTACGETNDGVTYIWLTGSDNGYRISEYSTTAGEYFTEGYIYNKKIFGHETIEISNEENEDAAAEFKISGSNLRIEIYEGKTLPSGNYIYVYSGKSGKAELIGDIYITKTDGKPEFNYEEYEKYSDYDYW